MTTIQDQYLSGVSDKVRVTFARVVVSEWRKLVSVRSTWWTLGIAVALYAGIGALVSLYMRSNGSAVDPAEATDLAIGPVQMVQLAIVVLAVMIITSEYSTGQIRVSATAVPTRLPLLGAKALVLSAAVFVAAVLGEALSVGMGLLIAGDTMAFGLPGAETARLLVGAPVYLVGVALLTFGVAGLMRSTGGAIATMMGLLVVVEQLLMGIQFHVTKLIAPWLPGNAGTLVLYNTENLEYVRDHVVSPGAYLGPWWGLTVLVAWAALFVVLAGVRLRLRDA
ncbi:MAG: ABC transporter permease [Micrococcales bacterium]|nr:ABC transporter permease [Micrococcales bacterium]